MAEKTLDPLTCDINVEDLKENDSFLKENQQAKVADHKVSVSYLYQYTAPYGPPYSPTTRTNLPSSTLKTWSKKQPDAGYPAPYDAEYTALYDAEYPASYGPPYSPSTSANQPASTCETWREKQPDAVYPAPYGPSTCANQPPDQHVPDYYCIAFFVCFFCAWPCGLLAMIVSTQAQKFERRGEYEKARSRARCALYLIIASVVCGLVIMGLSTFEIFKLEREYDHRSTTRSTKN